MPEDEGTRLTERLRLEPVGPANADALWLVHSDDAVWPSYGSRKPTRAEVERWAEESGASWRLHGAGKWIAYDRDTGEVVGRGGLGRTPVDVDWCRVHRFLPAEPWVRLELDHPDGTPVHAEWLELGWALRSDFRGRGFATEIGRAGLAYAFDTLDARAVVSCTARTNAPSRAVMKRLGMRYAGELWSAQFEGSDPPLAVCIILRPGFDRPERDAATF